MKLAYKTLFTNDCHKANFIYRIIDHLDVAIGLLQRLQENPQNISNTETMKFFKISAKTTEELFQNNERVPLGFIEDEVENVRNVPENIDEDDHDENQEIFAFDENMHENGHDENQENEANQNVLNVIVQEDNDEMNNAMIVEDSVDKLIPRNSNSFDLLNKDCQMTMKPLWR